jgi:hypothetical protein
MAKDIESPSEDVNEVESRESDVKQPQGNAFGYFNDHLERFSRSAQVVSDSLNRSSNNGTVGLQNAARHAAQQSMVSRALNGPEIASDEDLPVGPGFAYMNHLFKSHNADKIIKDQQHQNFTKGLNVLTNATDGVRTALRMLGVAGETNTDGLPIDMTDVFKLFGGDRKMDDLEKTNLVRELQDGSTKIDKKKIRKFVNQDGSITWEILNDDKTIMSRFTMGEYNGKKLFAQGGYKNFSDLLRQTKSKLGDDHKGEFESIRSSYAGRYS